MSNLSDLPGDTVCLILSMRYIDGLESTDISRVYKEMNGIVCGNILKIKKYAPKMHGVVI